MKINMPVFRRNWPRYSKRLAAWAKTNGAEYVFEKTDHGNYHILEFEEHYYRHIDPEQLLKLGKKEVEDDT